jgi:hypothetical protein
MGLSVFNTALNTVSKVSSFVGTGSQVLQGIKNPDLGQGISGVLTAVAGRSKFAKKLLTIDSRVKDIFTKLGGISDILGGSNPKDPIKVWDEDPKSFLNQAKSRPDPQMNFSWIAEVVSPNEDDELIEPIYIEEISAPIVTIEQHNVFREGSESSYISGVAIAGVTVKLYEDILGTAAKFIMSWVNIGYSNEYSTFTGSLEYKKQIVISLLDPYGTVSAKFVLGGCFPTSAMNGYDFTSGAGAPINPTVTLSVDTLECVAVNDDMIEARMSVLAGEALNYPAADGMSSIGFGGFKIPVPSISGYLEQKKAALNAEFGSKIDNMRNSFNSAAETTASSALGKVKSFF